MADRFEEAKRREEHRQTRRRLLRSGAGLFALVAGAVGGVVKFGDDVKRLGSGAVAVGDGIERSRARILEGGGEIEYRKELLRTLLVPAGHQAAQLATDYHDGRRSETAAKWAMLGYPNDADALGTYFELQGGGVRQHVSEPLFGAQVTPASHLVTAGSPNSSGCARDYLPYYVESASLDAPVRAVPIRNIGALPYRFAICDLQKKVWVNAASEYGKPVEKVRKALIFDAGGGGFTTWQPPGYSDAELLISDFLLITRIPRGPNMGTLVSFCGGHGPGTGAFRLLLDPSVLPLQALEEIVVELDGAPFFQIVLQATEMHMEERDVAGRRVEIPVAARLSVPRSLPPRRIDAGTLFA